MLLLSYGLGEVSLITGKLDTLSFKLANLLTWRSYIYSSQSLEWKVLGGWGSSGAQWRELWSTDLQVSPIRHFHLLFIFVNDVNSNQSKPYPFWLPLFVTCSPVLFCTCQSLHRGKAFPPGILYPEWMNGGAEVEVKGHQIFGCDRRWHQWERGLWDPTKKAIGKVSH